MVTFIKDIERLQGDNENSHKFQAYMQWRYFKAHYTETFIHDTDDVFPLALMTFTTFPKQFRKVLLHWEAGAHLIWLLQKECRQVEAQHQIWKEVLQVWENWTYCEERLQEGQERWESRQTSRYSYGLCLSDGSFDDGKLWNV